MYKQFDLGIEISNRNLESEENRCPICKLGNGTLCSSHVEMTKDYDKLRIWLNNQSEINEDMKYVIDFALSDRVSLIIEDVGILNNRLAIQEYLNKKNCSEFIERVLKEIQSLEKAKSIVIKKLNEE